MKTAILFLMAVLFVVGCGPVRKACTCLDGRTCYCGTDNSAYRMMMQECKCDSDLRCIAPNCDCEHKE